MTCVADKSVCGMHRLMGVDEVVAVLVLQKV